MNATLLPLELVNVSQLLKDVSMQKGRYAARRHNCRYDHTK
jgi:hypothetical protein